jgi:hypothetical protein
MKKKYKTATVVIITNCCPVRSFRIASLNAMGGFDPKVFNTIAKRHLRSTKGITQGATPKRAYLRNRQLL